MPVTTPEPIDEDALEPVELIAQSGAVIRLGRLMLSSGTGSYRVKTAMARAAAALGIDRHAAHVTLTEITATSHRGRIFRTEVTEVRSVGVNADRLARLEGMVKELPPGTTAAEITRSLDEIESRGPLYGALANALFAALACAAFAFLNNGGVLECAGVFVAAGLGQFVRRQFLHQGFNQFGVTMIAAAVACLAYLGFVAVLDLALDLGSSHEAGYVSAVLFLVPGFPLVTGGLDLAKLDFSAGVSRLVYALMILMSAGLSVWAISWAAGLSPDAAPSPDIPLLAEVGLRGLASFLGVLGFALLFNSPTRMALFAAAIGMIANTARLEVTDAGVPVQAATALASVLVGLLAAVVSPRAHIPRITLSVPAVVIMVPGAAAYRAIVELNNGDAADAVANGVRAVFVVAAIAIGLAVARMLTDRAWAYER